MGTKRIVVGLLALCIMALSITASAEALFTGKVAAEETALVLSPFGGTVKAVKVRAGESIEAGDPVAEIETKKVFAPADGTVRGIFSSPGDSVEGEVLYIAPIHKYKIEASIDKAYSSVGTKYVVVGEPVYIRCTKDGSHKAVGVVTGAEGDKYTVETTGGELYLEETVYIYRSSGYQSSSRIGSGTVARNGEIAVNGTGTLLKVHVQDGEEVERGQLLFETVEGTMNPTAGIDDVARAQLSGVVASVKAVAGQRVEKDGVLVTLYPRENYYIEVSVPEDSLGEIREGDAVEITFDWQEEAASAVRGRVTSISYVTESASAAGSTPENAGEGSQPEGQSDNTSSDNQSDEVAYTAYIAFTADETVRVGMNVTVAVAGSYESEEDEA